MTEQQIIKCLATQIPSDDNLKMETISTVPDRASQSPIEGIEAILGKLTQDFSNVDMDFEWAMTPPINDVIVTAKGKTKWIQMTIAQDKNFFYLMNFFVKRFIGELRIIFGNTLDENLIIVEPISQPIIKRNLFEKIRALFKTQYLDD